MSHNDRRERISSNLSALSESDRLRFTQRYADQLGVSFDEAVTTIARIESGETYDDIERIEAELATLKAEMLVLQRYMATLHIPIERPWMMALEMHFAAMRLLSILAQDPKAEDVSRGLALSQLAVLKRAESYSWSSDTATAAWVAARTVPTDTLPTLSLLPGAAGWWWFEHPLPMRLSTDDNKMQALLWATSERGIELACYALSKHGPILGIAWTWPYDMTYSAMVQGQRAQQFLLLKTTDISSEEAHDGIEAASRLFIAGCVWLQQRVVHTSSGHIERHRRKQLVREQPAAIEQSEIHVIQLRRAENEAHHGTGETSGDSIVWTCRWIVSGHWRNQPYASGERKLIYIMPFVKGPSDKPIKVPTHTVYEVSR